MATTCRVSSTSPDSVDHSLQSLKLFKDPLCLPLLAHFYQMVYSIVDQHSNLILPLDYFLSSQRPLSLSLRDFVHFQLPSIATVPSTTILADSIAVSGCLIAAKLHSETLLSAGNWILNYFYRSDTLLTAFKGCK